MRKYIIAILTVLLVATILRFNNITSESLWSDEGYFIHQSQLPIKTILNNLNYDVNPPLYTFTLRIWINLFGDSEFSVRALSAIFGIISIYLVYLVAKENFSKRVGLFASIITTFSVFHIQYSQEARSYTLFAMLCLLSYLFFFRLQKEFNKKNMIFYLITTILFLYSHIFSYLAILAQNISFFIAWKDLKKWILAQSILFVSLIPYLIVFINQLLRSARRSNWIPPPSLEQFKYVLFMQGGNFKLFFIFLLLSLFVFFILSRKCDLLQLLRKKEFAVFLWWFIPLSMSVIMSFFLSSFLFPRYSIAASLGLYILAGKGISLFNRRVLIALTLIIIILFSMTNISYYYYKPYKEDWRSVSEYIDATATDMDRVLFYPGFTDNLMYQYYTTKNITTYMVTFQTRELNSDDIVRMSPMFGEYEKIYLVLSHSRYSQELVDALMKHYDVVDEIEFRRIDVLVFHN